MIHFLRIDDIEYKNMYKLPSMQSEIYDLDYWIQISD